MKYPLTVSAADLRLADVVTCMDGGGYVTATVKQIKDGLVTLFRPYVETSDFTYTRGVICMIGIEEFKVEASPHRTFQVWARKEDLR